jgi:hypothetical protein
VHGNHWYATSARANHSWYACQDANAWQSLVCHVRT